MSIGQTPARAEGTTRRDVLTSRRDFLSTSAATTTGLGLSRSAHAVGAERFNVALVGAGGRSTGAAADCLRVAK